MRPPPKAVLIALADMANDEGFCWPSIDRICERTCYGRTTVIEAIAWLESAGIVRANRTNGRKTTYWVEPEKFAADAASEPSAAPQNQSAARTGPPRVPVRHADPTSPPSVRVPVRHADTNRHLTVKETKPPIPPAVAGGEHVRRAAPPKPGGHAAPDMAVFEALVAVYPRRKAQERARRQWVALAPDPALQQRILAAATAQAHGPEWLRLKAEGREHLIPMLSSWLHGRRWTDEVSAAPSSAGSARAWDETADGIVAMGVKLGLPPWDRKAFEAGRGEQFPVYAARVRNALRKMETGHAH